MGPQIAFHPGESVFPHIAAKYQPIETGQCSTQLLFILRDKIVHGVSLAFGVLFWNNKHPTSGETPLLSLVAAMLLCGAGGFACPAVCPKPIFHIFGILRRRCPPRSARPPGLRRSDSEPFFSCLAPHPTKRFHKV